MRGSVPHDFGNDIGDVVRAEVDPFSRVDMPVTGDPA